MVMGVVLAGCGRDGGPRAEGQLAWDRVELVAEAAEPIVSRAAREGQRVAAGDLILQLDATRAVAQARQASAVRAQAEARLAEVQRGPRREQVSAASADLAGAESAYDAATREFERVQKLAEQRLVSPDALDQARAARDRTQAARNAARSRLDELVNGATREQLLQAQAALAQAKAAETAANVLLERLAVRAPAPGRIDALPFLAGERPPAGAVVAVLLTGDAPYARVYIPEALRARITPGLAAQVRVDGIAKPFAGKVRRVSSDPAFTPYFALTDHDRTRLSYLAEVVIETAANDAATLGAGVPVSVTFEVAPK
jgi:HlyD family secretion protein